MPFISPTPRETVALAPPNAPRVIVTVRPVLDIPRSSLEGALNGVALAALIYMLIVLLTNWARLPEIVPSHFGASGEADGMGSRATLWILPGSTAALIVGFAILRRFPHRFNYPWKITLENAERQYALAIHLLAVIEAEIAVMFAYITQATVQVALGNARGFDPVIASAGAAVLLGTIIAYFYLSHQERG